MVKIICAPDSFKESLSAPDAARAMARGIERERRDADVDLCPVADGGDGTVEALLAATVGEAKVTSVHGPLGRPWVKARWGLLGRRGDEPLTAVIEMAAASGLAILPPADRDPTRTTTLGTGVLIRAALDAGAKRIIVGIGGSAPNDGGCGMAMALGAAFIDLEGRLMTDGPPTGGTLERIGEIDLAGLDSRIVNTPITIACDVTNPLTGPDGAAYIYGPQKGALPEQVEQLDKGLAHLGRLFREQLGQGVESMPGAGAAGGLGAGMVAFLNATLRPGIDLVLDAVGFERRVADRDLCLTGEGRLDGQSLSGKACLGVAAAAAGRRVETIALVGSIGPGAERTLDAGLKAYHEIGPGLPVAESIAGAGELMEQAAARVVREL